MPRDEFTETRALRDKLEALATQEAKEIAEAPQSIKRRFAEKRARLIGACSREAIEMALKLEYVSEAMVEAAVPGWRDNSDDAGAKPGKGAR